MIFLFVMTAIFLVAYKPLDRMVGYVLRDFFFRKKSYSHMTLMNLGDELSLVLNLQELANLVVNTFGEVLHLKTVAIVLRRPRRDDFEIVSAYGWSMFDSKRVRLSSDSPLVNFILREGPHVLVRDQVVRSLSWQEANYLAHDFDRLRASWIIPLFVGKELKGFIVFAAARPESIFDEADFHFFRAFARVVAKPVQNALIFEELRLANQELQDQQSQFLQMTKLKAIEQLAKGLAHEIHNPLTIISGKAQILLLQKDRNPMDPKVEEVLKTIVKQTKRAADITRKLLMFSQGSESLKETIHLEQVLEDTVALISYQTSLDQIEITRTVQEQIPTFCGNVLEIREVFLNLILNAVQSIGNQGEVSIEVCSHDQDQCLEVQISDTGQGIDPENIEKLFNPFFTTRKGAAGLGLFLTKQIVQRYGGSIRVESRLGKGSLFILRLPYGDSESKAVPEKESFLTSIR